MNALSSWQAVLADLGNGTSSPLRQPAERTPPGRQDVFFTPAAAAQQGTPVEAWHSILTTLKGNTEAASNRHAGYSPGGSSSGSRRALGPATYTHGSPGSSPGMVRQLFASAERGVAGFRHNSSSAVQHTSQKQHGCSTTAQQSPTAAPADAVKRLFPNSPDRAAAVKPFAVASPAGLRAARRCEASSSTDNVTGSPTAAAALGRHAAGAAMQDTQQQQLADRLHNLRASAESVMQAVSQDVGSPAQQQQQRSHISPLQGSSSSSVLKFIQTASPSCSKHARSSPKSRKATSSTKQQSLQLTQLPGGVFGSPVRLAATGCNSMGASSSRSPLRAVQPAAHGSRGSSSPARYRQQLQPQHPLQQQISGALGKVEALLAAMTDKHLSAHDHNSSGTTGVELLGKAHVPAPEDSGTGGGAGSRSRQPPQQDQQQQVLQQLLLQQQQLLQQLLPLIPTPAKPAVAAAAASGAPDTGSQAVLAASQTVDAELRSAAGGTAAAEAPQHGIPAVVEGSPEATAAVVGPGETAAPAGVEDTKHRFTVAGAEHTDAAAGVVGQPQQEQEPGTPAASLPRVHTPGRPAPEVAAELPTPVLAHSTAAVLTVSQAWREEACSTQDRWQQLLEQWSAEELDTCSPQQQLKQPPAAGAGASEATDHITAPADTQLQPPAAAASELQLQEKQEQELAGSSSEVSGGSAGCTESCQQQQTHLQQELQQDPSSSMHPALVATAASAPAEATGVAADAEAAGSAQREAQRSSSSACLPQQQQEEKQREREQEQQLQPSAETVLLSGHGQDASLAECVAGVQHVQDLELHGPVGGAAELASSAAKDTSAPANCSAAGSQLLAASATQAEQQRQQEQSVEQQQQREQSKVQQQQQPRAQLQPQQRKRQQAGDQQKQGLERLEKLLQDLRGLQQQVQHMQTPGAFSKPANSRSSFNPSYTAAADSTPCGHTAGGQAAATQGAESGSASSTGDVGTAAADAAGASAGGGVVQQTNKTAAAAAAAAAGVAAEAAAGVAAEAAAGAAASLAAGVLREIPGDVLSVRLSEAINRSSSAAAGIALLKQRLQASRASLQAITTPTAGSTAAAGATPAAAAAGGGSAVGASCMSWTAGHAAAAAIPAAAVTQAGSGAAANPSRVLTPSVWLSSGPQQQYLSSRGNTGSSPFTPAPYRALSVPAGSNASSSERGRAPTSSGLMQAQCGGPTQAASGRFTHSGTGRYSSNSTTRVSSLQKLLAAHGSCGSSSSSSNLRRAATRSATPPPATRNLTTWLQQGSPTRQLRNQLQAAAQAAQQQQQRERQQQAGLTAPPSSVQALLKHSAAVDRTLLGLQSVTPKGSRSSGRPQTSPAAGAAATAAAASFYSSSSSKSPGEALLSAAAAADAVTASLAGLAAQATAASAVSPRQKMLRQQLAAAGAQARGC